MSTDCFIARSPKVAARRIGDEVMIMSGLDSSLFSLNETAAILWECADGVTPLSSIVRERICPRFEVEFEAAMKDARELAESLAAHGIFLISDQPTTTEGAP